MILKLKISGVIFLVIFFHLDILISSQEKIKNNYIKIINDYNLI